MEPVVISQKDARKLTIHCQGLNSPYNNSLDVIQKLTYVQIDTISVTERAHNHVVFSRNPAFDPKEFNQLMNDKKIFEYWSHAAAYLPMTDFRYSLFRKESLKKGDKHWFPRDKKVEKYVLDRIKSEGPLQSKDFENPRDKNHEWYSWKPAKIALTHLFMDGSLMISNRQGFQKIFDLTENVLPSDTNTSTPTLNEYCNHLIFNAIKLHGMTTLGEIIYLRKGIKTTVNKLLQQHVKTGEIIIIKTENSDIIYYTTKDLLDGLAKIKPNKQVHILNPFDNMVIQRKRIKEIFDYDYQIECYVPEKKRIFGYYTLPVLYGNDFVGRLDAKADRKTKLFTIKNVWFESEFQANTDFLTKFAEQLNAFSIFCGCDNLKLEGIHPKTMKKELNTFI